MIVASGDGRRDLARAMGLCEAGERARAVVSGAALSGALDLLEQAVEGLLPLVVRVPVTGHRPLHAAADTGAAVLVATTDDEVPVLERRAHELAERALVPVLVACEGDVPVPTEDGLPPADGWLPSPTPAQELLFGRRRRRVPRWFDLDRPVARGDGGTPERRGLRRAGLGLWFQETVPALTEEVEAADGGEPFTVLRPKARTLILAMGAAVATARALAAEDRHLGVVGLRRLRPFPAGLVDVLCRARTVIVLERTDVPLAGAAPLRREIDAALAGRRERERPRRLGACHGLGGAALRGEDLAAYCAAVARGEVADRVHLGIDPLPDTLLPKRRVLHEALERARPELAGRGLRAAAPEPGGHATTAPAHAHVPARREGTHDDPTRFWDLSGVPLEAGTPGELAPDPYLAAGSVPAATSYYHAVPAGETLPAWDPAACTGCGDCWTACPDGALLPVVVTPASLLDTGIARARRAGADVAVLGRVRGRWVKALARREAGPAGAAVRAAAEPVLAKADDPALGAAVEAVAAALDPVAFARPDGLEGDERLVLALDPEACKGCGACVAACGDGALTARPRTGGDAATARAGAAVWHDLPDTPGGVIARLRDHPGVGAAAALSLARTCLHALAPGHDTEPGSGPAVAVRRVLAACEAALQPPCQQHLEELAALREAFAERIRSELTAALPAGDLDTLSAGLAALDRDDQSLSGLAGRLDASCAGGRVDTVRLGRLVETARALADLDGRLRSGTGGRGRARAGLAVTPGGALDWSTFPWNPFTAPVVLDGAGTTGARALGLVQGQVHAVCADLALVRRARALLDGGPPAPRELGWHELTEAERRLCPPLVVLADTARARTELAGWSALLASGLPVVVVVTARSLPVPVPDLGLLALAHRDAAVVQSTVAHGDHLTGGVLAALRQRGPALLHVLAPSPRAAGIAADEVAAYARDAVARRAFPLFRYDPAEEGVFGLRLSLDGNPEEAGEGDGDPVWQVLCEWAGRVTPFTGRLRAEIEAEVGARHRAERAEERAEHERRLAALRAELEGEMVVRLQRRLTALAGGHRR